VCTHALLETIFIGMDLVMILVVLFLLQPFIRMNFSVISPVRLENLDTMIALVPLLAQLLIQLHP